MLQLWLSRFTHKRMDIKYLPTYLIVWNLEEKKYYKLGKWSATTEWNSGTRFLYYYLIGQPHTTQVVYRRPSPKFAPYNPHTKQPQALSP